jgi:hypothetical protein
MTYTEIHEQRARYWMDLRMLYEFGKWRSGRIEVRGSGAEEMVNRVSESRTGGTLSIGRSFLLFFSSLLFSSPYFISSLDLGPI